MSILANGYNIGVSKKALQDACRFSLPPNSLGYCGRSSAPEKFRKCVTLGVCDGVKEELEKFIVLNPYLETLSNVLGKPKFSPEVIKLYWLGGDELERVRSSDYNVLLDNFSKQGVPGWFVSGLREKPPKKFIPNHAFQVLYVGVGRASGSVPFSMLSINNCLIRCGNVIRTVGDKITVDLFCLSGKVENGKIADLKIVSRQEDVKSPHGFLPTLKAKDIVAVHWGQAIRILTKEEARQLRHWTSEVLKLL